MHKNASGTCRLLVSRLPCNTCGSMRVIMLDLESRKTEPAWNVPYARVKRTLVPLVMLLWKALGALSRPIEVAVVLDTLLVRRIPFASTYSTNRS